MNKGDLIAALALELGGTKSAASDAVTAFLHCLTKGLEQDGHVTLAGFGTFSTKQRQARMTRHPKTGRLVEVKACTTVSFKASDLLKDSLADHEPDAAEAHASRTGTHG